ncbi:porin [Paraburkholderia sp. MM5482-R1]|uniref:porin n=1 Tax=unclassified Paraburkholderia TaxID=2615204 RepID=UPI003D207D20
MYKRYAAILATSTLCTGAYAQSSVTLYGIVDASLAYVNSVSTSVKKPGQHVFELVNGEQSSSRWGLLGFEDLGGGTRAIFRLEGGFNVTNGTMLQGGRLFGRQAYVGLSNKNAGTLTLGRQYELGFQYVGDMTGAIRFAGQWGSHVGDADGLYATYRINNAVQYETPQISGLRVSGLYGFSNQAGGAPGDGFANNRAMSVGVRYEFGPARVAVTYTQVSNPYATGSTSGNSAGAVAGDYGLNTSLFYQAPVSRQQILAAGALYKVGSLDIGVVYSHVALRYVDQTLLKLDNYEINASYFFTPSVRLSAEYVFTNGRGEGGNSTRAYASGNAPHWHQIDLAADYALSKATDVYLVAIGQRAAGDAEVASLTNVGGPAGAGAHTQIVVGTGLRHKF